MSWTAWRNSVAPGTWASSPRNRRITRSADILRSLNGLSDKNTKPPLVCPPDRDELLELLPHQLKRNALVGLDAAVDPARILLREEALGDDRVEIEIGPDRREQDRQDEERVVERPAERVLVAAQHGVEAPLGRAVKAALLLSLAAPEQQCAHHRSRR